MLLSTVPSPKVVAPARRRYFFFYRQQYIRHKGAHLPRCRIRMWGMMSTVVLYLTARRAKHALKDIQLPAGCQSPSG